MLTKVRFVIARGGSDDVTIAILTAELSDEAIQNNLAIDKVFQALLTELLTEWVCMTYDGKRWWTESCCDANIGDLAANDFPGTVREALKTHGVHNVELEIICEPEVCRNWTYDSVLVDESKLPEGDAA
jgi:hypothetical protein